MYKKIAPFDVKKLKEKKLKPVNNFQFASNAHVVSLVFNELNRVASVYPIVFLKQGEDYGIFALTGLKQGENLFIDKDGNWQGGYIPAVIRRYPFVLGRSEGKDEFLVCIDEESEFLSDDEGQPLVTQDGKPAEVVDRAKEFLAELHRSGNVTMRFCKEMAEKELLTPLNMQIKSTDGGVMQNIDGCYSINEKKLNELPDDAFLDIRKRGILPLIYAHLISLGQLERLVRLRTERG